MAYLMEFLEPLSSEAQEKQALASPEFREWEKLKADCDVMLEMGYFTGDGGQLSKPEELVLKKEERLLDVIWKRYQYIPAQMRYSALGIKGYSQDKIKLCTRHRDVPVVLHEFSDFSRVKLADLRTAATKLSYMILPACYVDGAVLSNIIRRELQYGSYYGPDDELEESECMIMQIANFTEQEFYVLCPVSLYNLCRAEQDEKPREVFFGGELAQAKAFLDTITRIQRNLFAILNGNEADTGVWEVGEGSECSEKELIHLKILVETIMPIQYSLLEIVRESRSIEQWEKKCAIITMRKFLGYYAKRPNNCLGQRRRNRL